MIRLDLGRLIAVLGSLAGPAGLPAFVDGRTAVPTRAALGRATNVFSTINYTELSSGKWQDLTSGRNEKIIGFVQLRKLLRQANQNTLPATGE